jgi:hypothetical protein
MSLPNEERRPILSAMSELLTETKALLAATKRRPREISAASGVGYDWLIKFARGVIQDPGISRVQRLHDFLSRDR